MLRKKGLLIFLAALAAVLFVGSSSVMAAAAPEFSLDVFGGGKVDNKSLKGKDTALVLFNTSCSICRGEIKDILSIQQQKKSFDVVLVCIDMNYEKRLPSYIKAQKLDGVKIALDPGFSLGRAVGVSSTPAVIMINKKGELAATQAGYDGDKKGLLKLLKSF